MYENCFLCLFIYLSNPQSLSHQLCKYYLFVFGGKFSLAKKGIKNFKIKIKNILSQVFQLSKGSFFEAEIKFDVDFLPFSKKVIFTVLAARSLDGLPRISIFTRQVAFLDYKGDTTGRILFAYELIKKHAHELGEKYNQGNIFLNVFCNA